MAIKPKKLIRPQINIAIAMKNGMGAKKCDNVTTNKAIPPKNNPNEIGSMDQPDFGLKRFSSMILVVVVACDMDLTFTENGFQLNTINMISYRYHIVNRIFVVYAERSDYYALAI